MKTITLFETNDDVKISRFAGGENHVRFLTHFSESERFLIHTRLNSSDDLMTLCLAVDALRNMGVEHIEVFIPYVPYARQDRVMVPGEPLSIKVFASIINQLQLKKVRVFDAHSDVAVALIDRCENTSNHEMVKHFLQQLSLKDFMLVSPDLGAYKKIDKLATAIGNKNEIVTGLKIRDLKTGEIIKSDVNIADLHGKDCVVVDDICDGGRTFIELASALQARNAGKLYFICSHGIFSHDALTRLKEAGYETVCCSNSVRQEQTTGYLKQYDVFQK